MISTASESRKTILDDRYQIVRMLGAGGMGEVYLAEDLELGRQVAVKLVHARHRADARFREQLTREARNAARLNHPNIVPVFDLGEADGAPYIAMEFVEGRNLKELVRGSGPLSPARAIDYTRQILAPLSYAHARGIIHRDVKPQNILVTEDDRLKLTDLGIAKAADSERTDTGSIVGTADYLAPERTLGGSATIASDLYAVGVILYEILVGKLPFVGETPLAVALKHASEQPTPPSRAVGRPNAGISPELDRVVLRALAKAPAERFESAEEFSAALGPPSTEFPVTLDSTEETTATLPAITAPTQIAPTQLLRPSDLPPPRQRSQRHPPLPPRTVRARPRKRVWPWPVPLWSQQRSPLSEPTRFSRSRIRAAIKSRVKAVRRRC